MERSNVSRVGFGLILVILMKLLYAVIVSTIDLPDSYAFTLLNTFFYNSVIPILVLFPLLRKQLVYPNTTLKTSSKLLLPVYLLSLFLGAAGGMITQAITSLITGKGVGNVYSSIMPEGILNIILFWLSMGILAPLAEELIFRELILLPLRKYGDFTAILIQAVFFSLYHGNVSQLFYTFLLGALLGYVAVKFNSIKPAIILHITYNVTELIRYWLREYTIPIAVDVVHYALAFSGIFMIVILIKARFFKLSSNVFDKTVVLNIPILISIALLIFMLRF